MTSVMRRYCDNGRYYEIEDAPDDAPLSVYRPRARSADCPVKVSLSRVLLNSEGYDCGGVYWGHGVTLWYATTTTERGIYDMFLRAGTRDAAEAYVRAHWGANVKFLPSDIIHSNQ